MEVVVSVTAVLVILALMLCGLACVAWSSVPLMQKRRGGAWYDASTEDPPLPPPPPKPRMRSVQRDANIVIVVHELED